MRSIRRRARRSPCGFSTTDIAYCGGRGAPASNRASCAAPRTGSAVAAPATPCSYRRHRSGWPTCSATWSATSTAMMRSRRCCASRWCTPSSRRSTLTPTETVAEPIVTLVCHDRSMPEVMLVRSARSVFRQELCAQIAMTNQNGSRQTKLPAASSSRLRSARSQGRRLSAARIAA